MHAWASREMPLLLRLVKRSSKTRLWTRNPWKKGTQHRGTRTKRYWWSTMANPKYQKKRLPIVNVSVNGCTRKESGWKGSLVSCYICFDVWPRPGYATRSRLQFCLLYWLRPSVLSLRFPIQASGTRVGEFQDNHEDSLTQLHLHTMSIHNDAEHIGFLLHYCY